MSEEKANGTKRNVLYAIAVLGFLGAALVGSISFLADYFQTDADAGVMERRHETDMGKVQLQHQRHVGDFNVHVEAARSQSEFIAEMRADMRAMRQEQQLMSKDQIKLLERWRLRPSRRPVDEP